MKTFSALLKKNIEADRKKGKTLDEIGKSCGVASGTSLMRIAKTGKVSRPVYTAMCAYYPALEGTLDLSTLLERRADPRGPLAPEQQLALALPAPARPRGRPKKVIIVAKDAPVMTAFELGVCISAFVRKPEAPVWIELLRAAVENNVPLPMLLASLVGAQAEVADVRA